MTTDIYEAADLRRKQLRESFACPSCGSPDPAVIRDGKCSDCTDWDRCPLCRRWLSDGSCVSCSGEAV